MEVQRLGRRAARVKLGLLEPGSRAEGVLQGGSKWKLRKDHSGAREGVGSVGSQKQWDQAARW